MRGIFSLNVAGFEGTDKCLDVRHARFLTILEKVQYACRSNKFVCLQEVHKNWLEALFTALDKEGYKHFSCLNNRRIDVYLLTAVPKSMHVIEHSVSIPDGSDQYALVISIDNQYISNVHFAVRLDFRLAHTTSLIETLFKLKGIHFVVGDMNLMGDHGGFDQLKLFQEAGFFDLTYTQHVPDLDRKEFKWFHPYNSDTILQKENLPKIISKSIMLDAALIKGGPPDLVRLVTGFLDDHASDHPYLDIFIV